MSQYKQTSFHYLNTFCNSYLIIFNNLVGGSNSASCLAFSFSIVSIKHIKHISRPGDFIKMDAECTFCMS